MSGCPWFASVFSAGPLWLNCALVFHVARGGLNQYSGLKSENKSVMNLICFSQPPLLSVFAFLVFHSQRMLSWTFGFRSRCRRLPLFYLFVVANNFHEKTKTNHSLVRLPTLFVTLSPMSILIPTEDVNLQFTYI